MKTYTEEYRFSTEEQFQIVDLTGWLREAASNSDIKEGLALVSTGHTTGALIINEHESRLLEDLRDTLLRIVPDLDYRHPRNAQSHLVSMMLSSDQTIPIKNGMLELGRWQSLFWVEAEKRPRERTVQVTTIGE
ncbi:MAG: secondary thiamine-phosphate synthase enzyme YjbQ [Candidatus Bathyarchaeia archaeon]